MAKTTASSTHHLQLAQATLLIEQASLRYLNWGDHELIRRIYPAVRDENWMTVPYKIESEKTDLTSEGFETEFHLHFYSATVDYTGIVSIRAAGNQLSYSFSGIANRDFSANRIGICVLQPVSTCAGRKVKVTHPDGSFSDFRFPEKIAPHQPFIDIHKLEWTTDENVHILAEFRGDIFETEDQRNWSDMSFKTYSTPLTVPIPRRISVGDKVEQSVFLTMNFPQHPTPVYERIIHLMSSGKKFPAIGYSRPEDGASISEKEKSLLKKLIFDHYRIDIDAENWSGESIKQLAEEVKKLQVPVELVIHANWPSSRMKELIREIKSSGIFVEEILLLQKNAKVTGRELWQDTIPILREAFPAALYGGGSNTHFTEINRFLPDYDKMAFVAFPNNPQVHASDDRTIIENLAAQGEVIKMAGILYPALKIHVSDIRLRYPNDPENGRTGRYLQENGYPWTVDPRQWSHFFARWTLLSLKYLAEADQLTYFNMVGLDGLMAGELQHKNLPGYPPSYSIFPVYEAMAEIGAFRPEEIFPLFSAHPLQYDGYCLMNSSGEVLFVLVNHSSEEISVRLINDYKELTAPEIKISEEEKNPQLRTEPLVTPGSGYLPFVFTEDRIMLKARSITYIRSKVNSQM